MPIYGLTSPGPTGRISPVVFLGGIEVGTTGGTETAAFILCPSCGGVYDTPELVSDLFRNSGFCLNLTCLEDLTAEPFDAVVSHGGEGRRAADLRAR